MNKQEDERILSSCKQAKEDDAKKQHPLCKGCHYGRGHEFCFPCWKYLLGQEGYH